MGEGEMTLGVDGMGKEYDIAATDLEDDSGI